MVVVFVVGCWVVFADCWLGWSVWFSRCGFSVLFGFPIGVVVC